ncbi:putative RNA-directed DNA polymerase from transposon X-element [Trichonephila clavipes]|nr:putative RNA-directed DNA polymerase from transposon X-element [Trichonephila clavipes]
MKIRPVFDASARDKSQPSLNDCLNRGPSLNELIPDIIDRFRVYPIGLSSDIEKAFLQLSIIPEHRDYLRFSLPNVEESKIYRHCRVVFGICSSPFQLSACIDHLLENSPARFDDVTQKLKHSFYVDNCVTGVTDIKEQESFINKAIEVMARGCFNLRGWESNVPGRYIFRSSGVTSLLGLLWDLDQDTLKCNLNYSGEGEISKRNVLAMEAWKLKLKWDDPLPENIQKIFRKWRDEIVYLEKVNIPRYVEINENSELHLFVDACKSSYGACVYIRTVTPLGVKIRLIRAKSRVAPLKTMTIPRLELMACCIGARLVHSVYAALDVPDLKIIAWSDSMVALWWLKDHGDWSVFVANRVNEINSLVPSQFWRHVPGELNPTDLLSRGISPRLFSDSLWWEGPSWLLEPPSNWPIDRLACETSEVEREKRKVRLCNLVAVEGEIPWYAIKFSNFQSVIRFVSWMLRFVENVKKKREFREIGDLTIHEIEHAEKTLIKIVQAKFFPSENSFPNMNVITDEEGIKRVKTRITERSDHPEFIYPIILPGECLFTQRLIEYYHRQNCHAGTQGRDFGYEPVSLPGDHVNDAAVFEVVGVDLAGPLYVKGGQKSWIVLFTCATYRAVHLELTSSLSTDAFLLSLRRFIARRGRPRVIYSDNGTNFRGAHGELSGIDWEKVLKLATIQRIIWKFNPPTAAWWGGWWERPLTYLSENSDDLVPLSPAMFLVENRNLDVPDINYRDTVNLRKRVRYRQKLLNDLRHRFRKEYLGLLIQNKNKKGPLSEVRLGEIVLIGDDIKKRMHWPLAKVIRLIPGKDGKIRTVELNTRTGTMLRPIQRVYPLEVQSIETPNDPLNDCTITNPISSISSDNLSDPNDSSNVLPRVSKYGRVIKVPEKLDLVNQVLYVFESK